ncbi:MAG TPA: M56 family metallopeptidase, partial [Rhodothermia bacterium]|nr:M56 family metallopeptidase [Rhodothermia bacterium]
MTAIAVERAASLLASASLKSFVILGIATLIVAAWRRSSASARHVVWTAAVGATIALPLLAALTPTWTSPSLAFRLPALAAAPAERVASAPVDLQVTPVATGTAQYSGVSESPSRRDAASPPDEPAAASRTEAARAPRADNVAAVSPIEPETSQLTPPADWTTIASLDWKRIASLIWLAGFVLILLPVIVAHMRLRRIASSARVVTRGKWIETLERARNGGSIARRVTLLESDDAAMPMTWGVFSPVLLLPAGGDAWPEWKRRNILLHELAHVERCDCLSQLIAQI